MALDSAVRLLLLILVSMQPTSSARATQRCLVYEPQTVALRGRITRRTFPGPPNYESVAKGDEAEQVWLLRLAQPVCVSANSESEEEKKLSQIQLVFENGQSQYKRYRSLVGKTVFADGTLFHSLTGHHHTNVLLTVSNIKAAK